MAECFDSNVSTDEESEDLSNTERSQNLLSYINQSRMRGQNTDITIVVGKKRFPAHRRILALLSDYFPARIKHDKNDSGEIILHGVKPESLDVLLKYAYTGKIDITNDNIHDIFIIADYLCVQCVKNLCIKFMYASLSVKNCWEILMFATQYSIPNVKKKAKYKFLDNLDDISQTEKFSQLDAKFLEQIFSDDNLIIFQHRGTSDSYSSEERERLILIAVFRYLSMRSIRCPEITEMMIRSVRLPQLSEDTVIECLENFKSLKEDEIIKKYLKLQTVAMKYLQGTKNDPFVIKSAHPEAQEIPDTWFKERFYGVVTFREGGPRYAAGGQIQPTPCPPEPLYFDEKIHIKRIEIWLRIWRNIVVIGGMKLFYRSTSSKVKASLAYVRGYCPEGQVNHVVDLEPDELIVKVVVGSGYLIDRLGFETNKGRVFGPFGGPGGNEAVEEAPPGKLSYLIDISYDTVLTEGAGAIFNLLFRWMSLS